MSCHCQDCGNHEEGRTGDLTGGAPMYVRCSGFRFLILLELGCRTMSTSSFPRARHVGKELFSLRILITIAILQL